MEKNNFIKKIISTIILVGILSLLGYVIYSMGNYVSTLEKQVRDRNVLIQRLTDSEKILNKYFDIEVDTLNNMTIYSLKDSLLDLKYKLGEESLSSEEMVIEYNQMINKYNQIVKKYNKMSDQLIELKDSTKNLNIVLELIKKNYGIGYKIKKDSIYYNIKLEGTSKVDSAMKILPYYGDKLHFEE